jgi:hypothetical protein
VYIKKPYCAFIVVIMMLMYNSAPLFARAGGAGDFTDTGSGSGDGWFLSALYFILSFLPYPYNFIAIGALLLIAFILWVLKKMKK